MNLELKFEDNNEDLDDSINLLTAEMEKKMQDLANFNENRSGSIAYSNDIPDSDSDEEVEFKNPG